MAAGRGEILDVEVRRRLFQIVREFPGLHIRELQRSAGIDYPLCDYHLRYLESHGLVNSLEEGGYKRYFPSAPASGHAYTEAEKRILSCLRQTVPLRIVLTLLEGPARHVEIVDQIGVSKSTASYHLGRMEAVGVVRLEPVTKAYELREKETVARLLYTHRPHRSGVDAFADAWLDLYGSGGPASES